ncbi:hypothetical protein CDAR_112071 [Caerostris darwini]|uniref:Uncharacterized protein n=1 Tax=Caerostris darwini TaxID=1538125 RepID=A0AAV4VEZ9_9ARAC|nr:hypothetical protein CDAR_112071 [Caerostris darwini]
MPGRKYYIQITLKSTHKIYQKGKQDLKTHNNSHQERPTLLTVTQPTLHKQKNNTRTIKTAEKRQKPTRKLAINGVTSKNPNNTSPICTSSTKQREGQKEVGQMSLSQKTGGATKIFRRKN